MFLSNSFRKSSFFYGCTDPKDPTKSRLLPYILSKITDMFSFESSRFTIHKSKESTARVALWREYKIPNIFTLEASFFGYDSSDGKTLPYTPTDYMSIGRSLCRSICVYISHIKGINKIVELPFQEGAPSKKEKVEKEESASSEQDHTKTVILNPKILTTELKTNATLLKYGDLSDDSGSDSSPSDDELPKEHLIKILPKAMKARIVKKLEEEKAKQPKKIEPIQTKTIECLPEPLKKPPRSQTSIRLKTTLTFKSKTERLIPIQQDNETQTEEFIFDMIVKIEKGYIQAITSSISYQGEQFVVITPSKK